MAIAATAGFGALQSKLAASMTKRTARPREGGTRKTDGERERARTPLPPPALVSSSLLPEHHTTTQVKRRCVLLLVYRRSAHKRQHTNTTSSSEVRCAAQLSPLGSGFFLWNIVLCVYVCTGMFACVCMRGSSAVLVLSVCRRQHRRARRGRRDGERSAFRPKQLRILNTGGCVCKNNHDSPHTQTQTPTETHAQRQRS